MYNKEKWFFQDASSDLVRHFLIEPTSKVRIPFHCRMLQTKKFKKIFSNMYAAFKCRLCCDKDMKLKGGLQQRASVCQPVCSHLPAHSHPSLSMPITMFSNVVFVWSGRETEGVQQQACICQDVCPHLPAHSHPTLSMPVTMVSNIAFAWPGGEAEGLQQWACICQPVSPHLQADSHLSHSLLVKLLSNVVCLSRAWSWRSTATSLYLPACLHTSISTLSFLSLCL